MQTDVKPDNRLVVMQLILNLDIGGAQEVVRALVKYLSSDQCTPIVCTFRDGPLRHEIEQLGIPVEILPQRKHSIIALPLFVLDMVRIWRALASLIKKYRIDVIQTHLLTSLDYLVLILLYTTPLRAVFWTFHNFQFEIDGSKLVRHRWLLGPKKAAHRLLYRWSARLVSGYIAIADQVEHALVDTIGPIGHKIVVIPNGVDISRYGPQAGDPDSADRKSIRVELALSDRTRLLVLVGTFKEAKGHRYMIEAMTSLAPQYPNLHLLFVGDGELRADLEAQAANAALDDRIHFLGSRHDVADLLACSDIFVLPSLYEGLSIALLEAMATGLPIVATRVSGTTQAIVPDEHGLLIPPGDTQAIVKAISQLLSDPDRARALGKAAKQRVIAEFDARGQADRHLELYLRTVTNK
jgi:glycosyltransferase involved in cell wall biosynthesis